MGDFHTLLILYYLLFGTLFEEVLPTINYLSYNQLQSNPNFLQSMRCLKTKKTLNTFIKVFREFFKELKLYITVSTTVYDETTGC